MQPTRGQRLVPLSKRGFFSNAGLTRASRFFLDLTSVLLAFTSCLRHEVVALLSTLHSIASSIRSHITSVRYRPRFSLSPPNPSTSSSIRSSAFLTLPLTTSCEAIES